MTGATKWHTEVFKSKEGLGDWEIAGGGFTFAEQFLDQETSRIEFGPLFAYMFRRFGPSEYGSDPHKDIAWWFVTTPDPNVILWVKPCLHGAKYSFGYGVNIKKYSNRRDDEQVARVNEALREAVRDLLTCTNIRDAYMNAAGYVPDESVDFDNTVPCFDLAGIGVDHEYLRRVEEE